MDDRTSLPLVTLGVAAHNEERYIRESLENLRTQTYPNIRILIGDNASTDGTSNICHEYAAMDDRIAYIRHPVNIGQNANFNYLARSAEGEYFCWISGHDLLDKDFVEKCVTALEESKDAVLACPHTMYMTADGQQKGERIRAFDIRHMSPQQRFRETMWRVDCNFVYGMYRLQPMLQSELFRLVPAADRVFLSEMAVKGTFVPVVSCKYYRDNRGGPQTEIEKRHRLMRYIYPRRTFTDVQLAGNEFYRPTIRGFYRVVQDASFPLLIRWRLYASVWLCGVMKSHLFPGADALSIVVKKILPKPLLHMILRQMR